MCDVYATIVRLRFTILKVLHPTYVHAIPVTEISADKNISSFRHVCSHFTAHSHNFTSLSCVPTCVSRRAEPAKLACDARGSGPLHSNTVRP